VAHASAECPRNLFGTRSAADYAWSRPQCVDDRHPLVTPGGGPPATVAFGSSGATSCDGKSFNEPPQVSVEAVLHAVRARGRAALQEPAIKTRTSRCDDAAKTQLRERIRKLESAGTPEAGR
jgi:hypothetical protein